MLLSVFALGLLFTNLPTLAVARVAEFDRPSQYDRPYPAMGNNPFNVMKGQRLRGTGRIRGDLNESEKNWMGPVGAKTRSGGQLQIDKTYKWFLPSSTQTKISTTTVSVQAEQETPAMQRLIRTSDSFTEDYGQPSPTRKMFVQPEYRTGAPNRYTDSPYPSARPSRLKRPTSFPTDIPKDSAQSMPGDHMNDAQNLDGSVGDGFLAEASVNGQDFAIHIPGKNKQLRPDECINCCKHKDCIKPIGRGAATGSNPCCENGNCRCKIVPRSFHLGRARPLASDIAQIAGYILVGILLAVVLGVILFSCSQPLWWPLLRTNTAWIGSWTLFPASYPRKTQGEAKMTSEQENGVIESTAPQGHGRRVVSHPAATSTGRSAQVAIPLVYRAQTSHGAAKMHQLDTMFGERAEGKGGESVSAV